MIVFESDKVRALRKGTEQCTVPWRGGDVRKVDDEVVSKAGCLFTYFTCSACMHLIVKYIFLPINRNHTGCLTDLM